jgi:Glycosyltransferase family 87
MQSNIESRESDMNGENSTFFDAIDRFWGWFVVSSAATAAVLATGIMLGAGWRLVLIGIGFVLFSTHLAPSVQNVRWRTVLYGILAGLVLVTLSMNAQTIYKSIRKPHQWDFLDFWIAGQCIVSDKNIYDPNEYSQIQLPFEPGNEFKREVLDVGFKYPPASAIIFMPLGYFPFRTAIIFWYGVQFIFFISSILLAFRLFAVRFDAVHLLLTAAMIMSLYATRSTFFYGQINFMALTFLLLFRHSYKSMAGGLFLALGIIVKPMLIIFIPFCLIRGHIRAFIGSVVALCGLFLIGLLVLGEHTFATYFVANPSIHFPAWMYTEEMNQSLLATILRISNYQPSGGPPVLNPVFISLSLLMTAVTTYLVCRIDRSNIDKAFILALTLALLLYPSSMQHYSLLLIVPIYWLWNNRRQMPLAGPTTVLTFIWLAYIFLHRKNGTFIFLTTLVFWLLFVLIGLAKPAAENV